MSNYHLVQQSSQIEILTTEANQLHAEGESLLVAGVLKAKQAGDALNRLVPLLPPGSWQKFAKDNLSFSLATANNYRKMAQRWDEIVAACGGSDGINRLGRAAAYELAGQIAGMKPQERQKLIHGNFCTRYSVGDVLLVSNPMNGHCGEKVKIVELNGLIHFAKVDGRLVPFLAGELEPTGLQMPAIAPRKTSRFLRRRIGELIKDWGEKAPKDLIKQLAELADIA